MIKHRIAALEKVTNRLNAPTVAEYEAAKLRALERYLEHFSEEGEHIPSPQETADNAIITAYESAYGKPVNDGTYERYIRKLGKEES